jgi:hypothetical protein
MKSTIYLLALVALLACTGNKKEAASESTSTTSTTAVQPIQPFNPTAGKQIADDEAKRWIKNYTDKKPDALRAYYFGADVYKKALETPGCVGLRVYLGLNDEGKEVMIIVPTDKDGKGILGNTTFEFGQACPPACTDPDTGI